MADPRELVDEFALRFEAGEEPDPAEWLDRVDGEQRQELGELIDRYLMTAPRRTWDPVAYETSTAKQAVDRVFESLEGVSGSWPELLPGLRNAARMKRSELVARLAEALGVGAGAAQVEKVGDYYNRMEHGLLPAAGVSGRVIEALAGIVGGSAEAIREAGGAGARLGSAESAAFARLAAPDPQYAQIEDREEAGGGGAAGGARSPGQRDEIDRLFTGG